MTKPFDTISRYRVIPLPLGRAKNGVPTCFQIADAASRPKL